MPICLSKRVERQLIDAINAASSREICAFLLQSKDDEQELAFVPNLAADPRRFAVSAYALKRVEKYAAATGSNVVAFLHSHYSGLKMSSNDRPSFIRSHLAWIIVCLKQSQLSVRTYDPPIHYALPSKQNPRHPRT